ncbi:MAG: calcium-binding protein, partial [bacterium]|nr:calcium-binding protein [bacterium]
VELDETFDVLLSVLTAGGRSVTFADDAAVGTITNDDSATVSIADLTQVETDGGTTFVFNVTMTGQVDTAVGATVNTADDTAVEGGAGVGDDDYEAISGGAISMAAGATATTVSVTVNGDEVVELDETFDVLLSVLTAGGRSVTFADDAAVGTITNDDSATVSIADLTQ